MWIVIIIVGASWSVLVGKSDVATDRIDTIFLPHVSGLMEMFFLSPRMDGACPL